MTPFVCTADVVTAHSEASNDSQYGNTGYSQYGYTSGIAEPVVHVINPEKDWIVRNSYGALIWVSRSTAILDIDHEDEPSGFHGAASIFSTVKQLGWQHRIYKTCNGYRVIISGIDAEDAVTEGSPFWDAVQSLPVDANYKQLCKKQRCFRARLSTKPWRSGGISVVPTNPLGTGIAVAPEFGITRLIASNIALNDGQPALIHLHDVMTGGVDHYQDGVELA